MTHRARTIPAVATVLGLSLAAGCGGSGPTTGDATPAPATQATSEADRVQQFLDAQYRPEDVRHSFRTMFGEDVDCIDFEAQPGVKALRAQGLAVPRVSEAPADPRQASAQPPVDPTRDPFFHGQLDENGNARACPDGSVPVLRITRERIASAGGLDAFLQVTHEKSPPATRKESQSPSAPDGCDAPGYAHVDGHYQADQIQWGDVRYSIFTPTVASSNDHSLAQTWTTTGQLTCGGTSNMQSVEVGWIVYPRLNGDAGPHLFIYATSANYANGCYNNWANQGWGSCIPYVQTSTSFAPGMTLPSSVEGGTMHELRTMTYNYDGNWWMLVDVDGAGGYIGYYPGSDFTGEMTSDATTFQFGGEVATSTGSFAGDEMGSGAWPLDGLGYAAYMHDYWAFGSIGGTWQYLSSAPPMRATSSLYTYMTASPPPAPWINAFYFGNQIQWIPL